MNKKVMLIILDGWGQTQNKAVSALAQAHTPYIDYLMANYPNATLLTSGLDVGLPDGQMGNSEVGHMNLGAGRIVYQDFVKINLAVESGTLAQEKEVIAAFEYAQKNNKKSTFSRFGFRWWCAFSYRSFERVDQDSRTIWYPKLHSRFHRWS
jgi:2,3-bisphosphoglycerate-independent phosphoglycerate mutase